MSLLLAPPSNDTTFADLRAALHVLGNTRPEGQRGVAECLTQLKHDVRQVKRAFARRLEQIQQRAAPRIITVSPGSDPDVERLQLLLSRIQSERECEREYLKCQASIIQRIFTGTQPRKPYIVPFPQLTATLSAEMMIDWQHRYRQLLAQVELNEREKIELISALHRYAERHDAVLRSMRDQQSLTTAFRQAAVVAVSQTQAAELRVRRLQSDVVTLQAQLDERDDAEDEIEATRARVRDLERALAQSERRLNDERRESDQLRRAQVRNEQRWLERLESLRTELDQEQALWIERRESEFTHRLDVARQQQQEAETQLEQAHAAQLQELRDQYAATAAEADERAAHLQEQISDLERRNDPRTLQEALDQCRRDCETKFALERQEWNDARGRFLSEHEEMRRELAALRGQLNRAKADEIELRARFASAVDTVETQKLDAEQRLADAVRAARDAERELFQEQLQRCERDHGSIVDELNARLAQGQHESQQAREQMAEMVRRLEADLLSSRSLHERTLSQLDRALADSADEQKRYERDLCAVRLQAETDLEAVRAQCRATCLQIQADADKAMSEAETSAQQVLEQRLQEQRASLQAASDEATRAVRQMAQEQLARAREEHDAELRRLRECQAIDTATQLQSEREAAQAELRSISERLDAFKSEFQLERERIMADCRSQCAVLEREKETIRSQLEVLQAECSQAHAACEKTQRDLDLAVAESEQRARALQAESDRKQRELSEVIDQQRDALDRERARSARKLRKLQEKLETMYGDKDARTEDRERIRDLEVDAARAESAAEQLANEIRFYKLELQNRDQALSGKYGSVRAGSGGPATAAAGARRSPASMQILRSASVVDVNTQAGFNAGSAGPVRPRRINPLPRT